MFRGVVRHLRRQPVAFVALFFALGGSAVAASQVMHVGDPAGGDLSGTYPNPRVATVLGGRAPLYSGEAAGGDFTGTYPSPTIAAGAVTDTKLANPSLTVSPGTGLTGGGSVSLGGSTTLGVADGGIATRQLADGSVTTSKFASNAEAPNAAELGGLSPSDFVSGNGKLLDSGRVDIAAGATRTLLSDSIVTVTARCNDSDSRAEVDISSPGQYSYGAQSGRLGFSGGIQNGGTTVTIGAATFAGNQLDMGTFYVDTSSSGNNRHLAGSFMALGQCAFWATALSSSD